MTLPNLSIYLSGSIKKSTSTGSDDGYWTEAHMAVLRESLKTAGYNAIFLNPASRSDDLSDELSLFGRDMLQVYLSDLVLADMREKRGIGIGYEIALANVKCTPVVSWAPADTHYRPGKVEVLGHSVDNWTHPFVSQPSERIIETLPQLAAIIGQLSLGQKLPLVPSDYVFKAIHYYLRTQHAADAEMQQIVQTDPRLQAEVQRILALKK